VCRLAKPSSLTRLTHSRFSFSSSKKGLLENLVVLMLDQNQFTGTIPTTIGLMTNLIVLNLALSRLTGSLPSELGTMKKLEHFILRRNGNLTGTIASTIGLLTNLHVVDLAGNQLTGPIPTEIGGLTLLNKLVLPHNQLSGPIPAEVWSLFFADKLAASLRPVVHELVFAENAQLSGMVPEGVCASVGAGLLQLHFNCTEKLCGCTKCACVDAGSGN